jgi:cell fate (sporulation/competence/biofilm development) regulator YlbF (YheA/YmcA/DUF963 family)
MKTFDILEEFASFRGLSEDVEFNEETGEIINNDEVLKSMLDEIQQEASVKLESIEYVKKEINASVITIDAEIKRLQNRKKGLNNNVNSLKNLQMMLLSGIEDKKLKTDKFTFYTQKTKSVYLDPLVDARSLPAEFRKQKIEITADKTALEKAIEDGKTIDGVELIENESVRVK